MGFHAFIGIDQTGAVVKGLPKALPLALIRLSDGAWMLETHFENKPMMIGSFCKKSLLDICNKFSVQWSSSIAVLVDCVLGLPEAVIPPAAMRGGRLDLWGLMQRTAQTPGFGRNPAEDFFKQFWNQLSSRYPKRQCEDWADANSVFISRPYQKNIQTGTFRLWKEMSREEPWLSIWPFEQREAPVLIEGYPSYSWRKLFGFDERSPALLKSLTDRLGVAWTEKELTEDQADAAILALTGFYLSQSNKLLNPLDNFKSSTKAFKEGWIAGLNQPIADAS